MAVFLSMLWRFVWQTRLCATICRWCNFAIVAPSCFCTQWHIVMHFSVMMANLSYDCLLWQDYAIKFNAESVTGHFLTFIGISVALLMLFLLFLLFCYRKYQTVAVFQSRPENGQYSGRLKIIKHVSLLLFNH